MDIIQLGKWLHNFKITILAGFERTAVFRLSSFMCGCEQIEKKARDNCPAKKLKKQRTKWTPLQVKVTCMFNIGCWSIFFRHLQNMWKGWFWCKAMVQCNVAFLNITSACLLHNEHISNLSTLKCVFIVCTSFMLFSFSPDWKTSKWICRSTALLNIDEGCIR